MNIVENILRIAKNNGVNDQTLCRILKTNSSKIYDWKKGKSKPTANDIEVLSEYFDVSADYLMGRTSLKKSEQADYMHDQGFLVINRAAMKATPETRKKMEQLLRISFEDLFDEDE